MKKRIQERIGQRLANSIHNMIKRLNGYDDLAKPEKGVCTGNYTVVPMICGEGAHAQSVHLALFMNTPEDLLLQAGFKKTGDFIAQSIRLFLMEVFTLQNALVAPSIPIHGVSVFVDDQYFAQKIYQDSQNGSAFKVFLTSCFPDLGQDQLEELPRPYRLAGHALFEGMKALHSESTASLVIEDLLKSSTTSGLDKLSPLPLASQASLVLGTEVLQGELDEVRVLQ